MKITYKIGSYNCGTSQDSAAELEFYRSEVEQKISAAFPGADVRVEVVEGSESATTISGSDEDETDIHDEINIIANDVWNHGEWHGKC